MEVYSARDGVLLLEIMNSAYCIEECTNKYCEEMFGEKQFFAKCCIIMKIRVLSVQNFIFRGKNYEIRSYL